MHYKITPVSKPRMTNSDVWKKRPVVLRYRAFKDECRLHNLHVPEACLIRFYMPMPATWSKKKRTLTHFQPHQQKPDLDNLVKAVLDAVLEDDSHVHTIHASKVWVDGQGGIAIEELQCTTQTS